MIEGPLLNSAFAGDEVLKSPIEEAIKKARVPLCPLLAAQSGHCRTTDSAYVPTSQNARQSPAS
jgi:hypothetical protein